jgi:ankyrin repeat protein
MCLTLAVELIRNDMLAALVAAGAAVDAALPTGRTPLMGAVYNGDLAAVMALLEAGAAVNASTQSGITSLIIAASKGAQVCVRSQILAALLSAGATVDAADSSGWTALMHVSDIGAVTALLQAGADVNTAANGTTSLMLPVVSGAGTRPALT